MPATCRTSGSESPDFGCYDYRLFERNARVLGYHALVYQMGNSPLPRVHVRDPAAPPGDRDPARPGHREVTPALRRSARREDESPPYGPILDRATAVIVHSPWYAEQLSRRFLADSSKMTVVPLDWTRLADCYEEIIEQTVAARSQPQADGRSLPPSPHYVASTR